HMFLRHAAEAGAEPEDALAPALDALRELEKALGEPPVWGLVEPIIAGSDAAPTLSEIGRDLPETFQMRGGREVRLREPLLAYADALALAEPAYRRKHWPEQEKAIAEGEARLRKMFTGQEDASIEHLVDSLGMQ